MGPDPPVRQQRPRLLTPGFRTRGSRCLPLRICLGPQRLRSFPGGDLRRSTTSFLALRWALPLLRLNKWLEGGRRERPPRPPPQQPGSGGGGQQVRQLSWEEGASSLPRPQPRHPAIPAPPAPPSESPAPRPPTQPPVPPFPCPWRAGLLSHLHRAASLRPRHRKSSKEDRNEDGGLSPLISPLEGP